MKPDSPPMAYAMPECQMQAAAALSAEHCRTYLLTFSCVIAVAIIVLFIF